MGYLHWGHLIAMLAQIGCRTVLDLPRCLLALFCFATIIEQLYRQPLGKPMISLARAYPVPTELIAFGSVLAGSAVALLMYIVRTVPERQRSGLTFLLPYLLLTAAVLNLFPSLRPLPAHSWAAVSIFAAAAFGFALSNFQFPQRAHYVNGVVSGLVSGLGLTYTGAYFAFQTCSVTSHNHPAFWTTHGVFLLCWAFTCRAAHARNIERDSSTTNSPEPPTWRSMPPHNSRRDPVPLRKCSHQALFDGQSLCDRSMCLEWSTG